MSLRPRSVDRGRRRCLGVKLDAHTYLSTQLPLAGLGVAVARADAMELVEEAFAMRCISDALLPDDGMPAVLHCAV